jgi:hypothetical protein
MTDKHTPGPWEWAESYNGLWNPETREEVLTHQDYEGMWLSYGASQDANARLIAAAPDLLDALRGIVALWDHHASAHGDGVIYPLHKAAKSAIAKATGEGA